jgi:hypothetical protein
VEISAALRERWTELSALAAMRIAHGWTQQDAADEWTRRWPDQIRSPKEIGLWENWPTGSGRRPSLTTLDGLAELYQCSVADLVADVYDYRHLDEVGAEPGGVDDHLTDARDAATAPIRDTRHSSSSAATHTAVESWDLPGSRGSHAGQRERRCSDVAS